jgi:hypothetical protein
MFHHSKGNARVRLRANWPWRLEALQRLSTVVPRAPGTLHWILAIEAIVLIRVLVAPPVGAWLLHRFRDFDGRRHAPAPPSRRLGTYADGRGAATDYLANPGLHSR